MTQTVKNLSRRSVSFTGNTGQTWHLPPLATLEVPDFELSGNAKVEKLQARHLLKVAATSAADAGDARDDEADQSKESSGKKTSAKR